MSLLSLTSSINVRKKEMENRINSLRNECEKANINITKLLIYADSFLSKLDCDLPTLKARYLTYMQYLDEFIYTITDFNIAIEKMDIPENYTSIDSHSNRSKSATPAEISILDMTPEKIKFSADYNHKFNVSGVTYDISVGKLLRFASNSGSSDSVTEIREDEETLKHEELERTIERKEFDSLDGVDHEKQIDYCNLPAQVLLENDDRISCTITHVDNPGSFYIILSEPDEIEDFHSEMVAYYNRKRINFPNKEAFVQLNLTYCACLDGDAWYRCLVLNYDHTEEEIELFVVDFGHTAAISYKHVQPLPEHFFTQPAFARACHLAGIEPPLGQDGIWSKEATEFMSDLLGERLIAIIDDNCSESLSITLIKSKDLVINREMVQLELAMEIGSACGSVLSARKECNEEQHKQYQNQAEEYPDSDENPEYTDVLEAVQGYSNHDEADICRHYKGPPDTKCFKAVCKKKHIVIHPDGWTRDKEEVIVSPMFDVDLPEPGSRVRVAVTHVASYNLVCVQLVNDQLPQGTPEIHRRTNRRWPSRTLAQLTAEMNSTLARDAHRRLRVLPAVGQLVAALYPADHNWYRACVVDLNPEEGTIQVYYVDYGNRCWVLERNVRELDMAYVVLPFQAVRARLATVVARDNIDEWAAATELLRKSALNKIFNALIVSTEADEMSVVLFNEHGCDIAEYAATMGLIQIIPYNIQYKHDDKSNTSKSNRVRLIPG